MGPVFDAARFLTKKARRDEKPVDSPRLQDDLLIWEIIGIFAKITE